MRSVNIIGYSIKNRAGTNFSWKFSSDYDAIISVYSKIRKSEFSAFRIALIEFFAFRNEDMNIVLKLRKWFILSWPYGRTLLLR